MHFPRENKIFVVLEHVLSTHALPSVGRHLCLHRARNSGSTQCSIAGRVESPDFDDRDVARQATELLTVRYFCIINTYSFRYYAVSFHRIFKKPVKYILSSRYLLRLCVRSRQPARARNFWQWSKVP